MSRDYSVTCPTYPLTEATRARKRALIMSFMVVIVLNDGLIVDLRKMITNIIMTAYDYMYRSQDN